VNNVVDILKEQLDKIANFNLAIFGICLTIFTVTYSFIATKRDSFLQLNEELKSNANNLIMLKKVELIKLLLAKWKKINKGVLSVGLLALIMYLVSVISIAFVLNQSLLLKVKHFLLCGSVAVGLLGIILLYQFIKKYHQEIKLIK
jgi:hypothetical protein